MQKKVKNYIVAAAVTMFFGGAVLSHMDISYGDVNSEKESLKEMQNQAADAQKILDELENKKGDSEAYLQELDAKVSELALRLYELNQQVDTKNAEIKATQELIQQAEVEINEQYEAMKLRIQYMYENGNASYLSMILDSKSIADFLNRAEYISELTDYDRNMLKQLELKKDEMEAAKASLDKQLAELQTLQESAEAEKAATEQLMEAKNAEINEINASIGEAENQIQSLNDDIEAQKALVAEMESIEARRKAEEESRKKAEEESRKKAEEQKKNSNQSGSSTQETTASGNQGVSNGKYMWPVQGHSYISSYFSMRDNPFGGGSTEFHNGIDIPAPVGTPIGAVSGGQVAWSYYSQSAGNWIGIDHGNGTYSVYMHMSSRIAQEGDYVSAGQTIGLVGSTGRSTGPHLHLSIRLNGSYVDPLNYVSP